MLKNILKKSIALMITSILLLSSMIQQSGYAETLNILTEEQEKTIVFGLFSPYINFNPLLSTDSSSEKLNELLFRRLVKLNEKMEVTPDLLTQMPQISGDGISYTMTLHPDLKWQDGKALTAEDVKFSFDFIKDTNNISQKARLIELIESVDVLDSHTIKMNMRKFDPEFLYILSSIAVIPKHIWENIPLNALMKSDYNIKTSIGCGPYLIKEYVIDNTVSLIKNPNYTHGPTYSFEKVIFRVSPSKQLMGDKLMRGELDVTPLDEKTYEEIKNNPMLNFYFYDKPSIDVMSYNFNHPALSEKNVRQAIASMINKEDILKYCYSDRGNVTDSTWHMNLPSYNPNVKKWKYDKEIAMKLLDDAGWKVGANGMREKNGQPLQFSLITNKENTSRVKSCEWIAKVLYEIGIVVDVRFYEWNTLLSQYLNMRNFDACISGYGTDLSADHSRFYSSEIGKGVFNHGSYKNDEIDSLLNQARKTVDPIERKNIYDEVQLIVSEDQPIYTFIFKKGYLGTSKAIKNVKVYSMMDYYEINDWYKSNPNEKTVEEKSQTESTGYTDSSATKPLISDLNTVEWARQSIETLVQKGILTLNANNAFEPNATVTRGQYVDMLVKSLKLSTTFTESFTDVTKTSPYYTSLGIAKKLNLTKELGLKQIKSDIKITREECMVLTSKALSLAKKMKISGTVKEVVKYKDYKNISPSSIPSIYTMINEGYFTTKNQHIQPKGTLTKAEAAVLMYKLYLL